MLLDSRGDIAVLKQTDKVVMGTIDNKIKAEGFQKNFLGYEDGMGYLFYLLLDHRG